MLQKIREIAGEAGKRILSFYETDKMGVTYKDDRSPLTLADQAAHNHILANLRENYPDIPVISEEGSIPPFEERSAYKRFWLVDPLDGTKEFIKRNGEFTVNIALIEGGRVRLGAVHLPTRRKTYVAERGKGAWLYADDDAPVRLETDPGFDPEDLTVSVSRSHPSKPLETYLNKFSGLTQRALGSSLKFCYLAEQQVDFYPRFGPLCEWDTAAAHIVAEESGAAVCALDGSPLRYNKEVMKHSGGFIAASNPELLSFLMEKR